MKKKITITLSATIISFIVFIIVSNYELIQTTFLLCKVEIALSYYEPKKERVKYKLEDLEYKLSQLHDLRGELDSKRKDIAQIGYSASESVEKGYIIIDSID